MAIGQFMPHVWPDSGRTPDPYWSYVVAAMHMDDFDGNGLPIDVSPVAKTYSRGGVPALDGSSKVFGDACSAFSGAGQYFHTAALPAFSVPTSGNFTVEHWFRYELNGSNTAHTTSHGTTESWREPRVYIPTGASGGRYRIGYYMSGLSTILSGYIIEPGKWHHISYGRSSGNRFFFYVDGVLIGANTSTLNAATMSLTLAAPGWVRTTTSIDKFKGGIDEFRWWNGVSIRDGVNNFIPPTAPWADS